MEIRCLVMVSAGLMRYCGYKLGHRSILSLPVRSTRFVVDSERGMATRIASRCGRSYLIEPKTTAGARSSSSSLWPRVKRFVELGHRLLITSCLACNDQQRSIEAKCNLRIRTSVKKNRSPCVQCVQEKSHRVASPLFLNSRDAARVRDYGLFAKMRKQRSKVVG